MIGRLLFFARNRRGNVALVFGLLSLPLVGMVGAALDYSRAAAQHSRLQAAVDSATLALGKMPSTTTQAALDAQADALVKAFITDPAVRASITTAVTRGTGSIVVTASGQIATPLVSVVGIPTVSLSATSNAQWGNSRLRIALVLDVTASMNSAGKLAAMKSAATSLLTQLQGAAAQNGDIYVSVVPFAKDVNVGASNAGQPWIRWAGSSDAWDTQNAGCSLQLLGLTGTQAGCQLLGGTWSAAAHSTWNGCVMDRDQNYDTVNTAPGVTAATQFPAEQYAECPAQLMGLSDDWTALKAKIASLTANGSTNQLIGLAWGFQSLTAAPFTIPVMDPGYTYQQTIILLSDGLNTQNRFYGTGSSPAPQVDDRQRILCDSVRAANVTLFTVQVNTDGDPTSGVLQYCASDPGKFFLLTSADQIVTTFAQIGIALSNLRVAY